MIPRREEKKIKRVSPMRSLESSLIIFDRINNPARPTMTRNARNFPPPPHIPPGGIHAHSPSYAEIYDRDIHPASAVTNRNGHGRPNVAYRALEGLGAVYRVRRDPNDVPRLLRSLAQRRTQSMRAFRAPLAVVHVHELLSHRLVKRRGTDVGVR